MADDTSVMDDILTEDKLATAKVAAPAQLKTETPTLDTSPSAMDDVLSQPAAQSSQQSPATGTPQNPLQGLVEFSKKINEAREVGQGGFRESAIGHAVMDGQMSLEEAEKKIDGDERLKWQSNDVDAYERQSMKSWVTAIPVSLGIETAKALPFIEAQAKAAFGTGIAVGGATALTGIGTPFAVGVGGMAGLTTGAAYTADYITGQDYLHRRRQGASDSEAKLWAGINGLGQGLLSSLQFKNLASVPVNAAKIPLEMAAPSLAKAIMGFGNYATGLGKFVAQQATLGEAQKAVDLMTRAIEGTVGNHPNMVPTVQQATDEFKETLTSTIASSIVLHAAGSLAGFTGGKFLQTITQAHDAHLEAQQAKLDTSEPAKAISTDKTLKGEVEKDVEAKPPTKAELRQQAKNEHFSTLKSNHAAALRAKAGAEHELEASQAKIDQIKEDIKIRKEQLKGLANNAKGRAVYSGEVSDFDEASYFQKESAKLNDKSEEVKGLKLRQEQAKQELRSAKELEKESITEITKIEKQNHKEARARLKKVVDKIEPPKENGQPNSRLARGTDIQSVLNRVKEFVDEPTKVTIVRSKYESAEAGGRVTIELQAEMDIANFVGDIGKLNTAELNKLADHIESTYKEGKAGRIKELADAAKARHQLVRSVIEGLQGNTKRGFELEAEIDTLETAGKEVPKDLRKQLEVEKGKTSVSSGPNPTELPESHVPGFAKHIMHAYGNWPSMLKNLFRNAANRDELVRTFWTGDILNRIRGAHVSNIRTLFGHLQQETGLTTPEINELLRKGAKNKITVVIDGEKVKMTANEAMDKLAQWNDSEGREALMEGNRFSPENAFIENTAGKIEHALNDLNTSYTKMWKGYIKAYKEIYPRLAQEYKEKTGVNLPDNPDYSGPMTHRRFSGELSAKDFGTMLDQGAKGKRNTIVTPGSTKARTGDTTALAYQDIHTKFKNYSSLTENWIGWRKPISDIFGPILNSQEVNTIIKNKFGEDRLKAFHSSFENIVFGRVGELNAVDRWMDKYVFSNIPYSMLAGKPAMFVKHVLSTANGARYIPSADYVEGMVEFYANPIKYAKLIGETVEYQARHEENEIDTASSLKSPEKMEARWYTTMQNFFMAPTIYGIRSEAAQIYAIRRYWLKEGLSEKEAMIKADAAVNESQVSGRADMQAVWKAQGGTFGKLAFAFQSQPNSQALDVLVSWDRFHALPTKANFIDAMKASTGAAFTVAVFESTNAAWRLATAKDEKQTQEAAFDMIISPVLAAIPFMGLPIIKDVEKNGIKAVADLYAISQGEAAPFGISADDSSIVMTWAKSGEAIYHDAEASIKDPDWIAAHFFKALADTTQFGLSPFVKTPVPVLAKTGQKLQDLSSH